MCNRKSYSLVRCFVYTAAGTQPLIIVAQFSQHLQLSNKAPTNLHVASEILRILNHISHPARWEHTQHAQEAIDLSVLLCCSWSFTMNDNNAGRRGAYCCTLLCYSNVVLRLLRPPVSNSLSRAYHVRQLPNHRWLARSPSCCGAWAWTAAGEIGTPTTSCGGIIPAARRRRSREGGWARCGDAGTTKERREREGEAESFSSCSREGRGQARRAWRRWESAAGGRRSISSGGCSGTGRAATLPWLWAAELSRRTSERAFEGMYVCM